MLPGEVTITREELRVALNAGTRLKEIGQCEYWDTDFDAVERGLFGHAPEGSLGPAETAEDKT